MRSSRDFVVDLVDRFTVPAQGLGSAWHVDGQRIVDRLTHVQGFQQRQLFDVRVEQGSETDHGGFALGRGQTRPDAGRESSAGVFYGTLGIGFITAGDLRQQAAVDRAEAFERRAGNGGGVFTVDESAAFDFQLLGTLFPIRTSQGGHTKLLLLLRCSAARGLTGTVKNSGLGELRAQAPATLNHRRPNYQYI
ncbi:hypothetical protein D9M73_173930 [compost metagenome]